MSTILQYGQCLDDNLSQVRCVVAKYTACYTVNVTCTRWLLVSLARAWRNLTLV